ncbi:DMT family transporter [Desulfosporosinus sp. PR]|uniref:DMT family transporter n=1 Tax=Candidatus Desulfosporosinus nitrosoreducens TaxID=3401928 RepID=UPI0027E75012|nr:DMT family transporter [Desulfosporosinus sp. PR]MDQ7095321.1 DMT family transporter [Desulfosporosinus sp. PR]
MKIGMINGILSAAFIGILLSLTKICIVNLPVVFFSMVLFGGTHFIFLVVLLIRHKGGLIWAAGRRYPELYLVGLLASALNLMQNWGLKLSSPANVAILLRGDLFFSLIIGYVIWKQKLCRLEWAGMGAMLVGVSLVLQISWSRVNFGSMGDFLILGGALLLAVNAEIIKHRLGEVEGILVAYYNSGMCFAVFLCGTAWTGAFRALPEVNRETWLLVLTSIFLQVVQYLAYYRSIKGLPTWLVRVVHLFTPVVAIVTSSWWLHETISFVQIGGMLLVGSGIALICRVHAQKSLAGLLT